jgi:hypothetical protein
MVFLDFFATSGKCIPPKNKRKHFSGNQVKFFFD